MFIWPPFDGCGSATNSNGSEMKMDGIVEDGSGCLRGEIKKKRSCSKDGDDFDRGREKKSTSVMGAGKKNCSI